MKANSKKQSLTTKQYKTLAKIEKATEKLARLLSLNQKSVTI